MKSYKWVFSGLGVGVFICVAVLLGLMAYSEYNMLQAEYAALQTDYINLAIEKQDLQNELEAKNAPLKDFETVTEFKDWISLHIQEETAYIEDSLLAVCKVQEAGIAAGYLMGISIGVESFLIGESASIGITTFINDTLYWWFVEDGELYIELNGLKK